MIIAKTPLRIPLAGGLTDIKPYATQFGGVTVSCTIDKYAYVVLKESHQGYFDLRYQDVHERLHDGIQVRNDLIREAFVLTGPTATPLELTITIDLASESGLGSSGTITVALLHAMHLFKGESVTAEQLYREAAHIEVDVLEGASGYHDPTICALGGLKLIEYTGSHVHARDLEMSVRTRTDFETSLLFFYSGRHARSKPSLALLSSHLGEALTTLHDIKRLGYHLEKAFAEGDLTTIGTIIGEQQSLKERLPGDFSDPYVRDITARVRVCGGFAQLPGGKISAFVIVYAPPERHADVRNAVSDLEEVAISTESKGSCATTL